MSIRNAAITVEDLRARLRTGLVQFAFVKKDGTLRMVHGTTNLRHVPASQHPNGNGTPSERTIRFWDLLTGEWRSAQVTTQFFLIGQ